MKFKLFNYLKSRFLSIKPDSSQVDMALEGWRAYCNNQLSSISDAQALALQRLDYEATKSHLLGSTRSYRKVFELKKPDEFLSSKFSKAELSQTITLATQLLDEGFCNKLVNEALEQNQVSVQDPFGQGLAYCKESFHISSGVTCLRFISPNQEVFFLFQYVTSGDAIYFPTRDIIFIHQHVNVDLIQSSIHQLCRNFAQHLKYSRNSKQHRFLGLVATQGRPYHLYYDVLLGMHQLHLAGLIERLPALYALRGGVYISMKSLYDFHGVEHIFHGADMELYANEHQGFLLQAGLCYTKQKTLQTKVREMDTYLVDHVLNQMPVNTASEISTALQAFPLVWFGISIQKRAWVEQVEGTASLIRALKRRFPNMGIVIDGWTQNLYPSVYDEAECRREFQIFKEIKSLIPDDIPVTNLIGAQSARKIAFACAIDLFITNYGTASINVARMAEKPGVAHASTTMPKRGHLHYNTIEVDNSWIHDIPHPEVARHDFVSYSLDWERILATAEPLLEAEALELVRSSTYSRFATNGRPIQPA